MDPTGAAQSIMNLRKELDGKPPMLGAFPKGMEEQFTDATRQAYRHALEAMRRNGLIADYNLATGEIVPAPEGFPPLCVGLGTC